MATRRTPRHRAGETSVGSFRGARRRSGEGARHQRFAPGSAGAVTAGIAAVVLLGPGVGLAAATVSGEVGPERAGPLGPMVAALQGLDLGGVDLIAERPPDAASTGSGSRSGGTGTGGTADRGAVTDGAAPADGEPQDGPPTDGTSVGEGDGTAGPGAGDPTGPTGAAADGEDAPDAGDETAPAPSGSDGQPADAGTTTGETTTNPRDTITEVAEPGPGAPTVEAAAVVELTNARRVAAGCGPLAVDERLTAAAQLHSEDMVAHDYLDHTSLDGRSPWDRAKAQGYAGPSGENIAAGQRTAEEVVQAWMDSPGHRANILSCDFQDVGVGYVDGVWTQLFGWG